MIKPFVKWAGGKGQLLDEIRRMVPEDIGKSITKYAEPFVGGGAVLFDMLSTYSFEKVYISDVNAQLINTYLAVRDTAPDLIAQLANYQLEYWALDKDGQKEYYYAKRARYNKVKEEESHTFSLECAALFIFLNRTCFNGLYRVNRKGEFNVPIGAYHNPVILNEENILDASRALRNVEIICGDYHRSADFIDQETLVYCDPPYRPLTQTASFTAYTESLFDDHAQIELANFVADMDGRGAKIIISNSDPKNHNPEDDFFDRLYAGYQIKRVNATRMINSKHQARGEIKELLICNYGGVAMKKREFLEWMQGFRDSIADYGYYVDFETVYRNVERIKVELNILNSLIGSERIEEDFVSLLSRYPEVLKCIPLLLAVREREIYAIDGDGEFTYSFLTRNYSVEQYKIFMRKTGLFDLMQRHIVHNLFDYATGVETGLSSHGRKNRGGHLMENLVEAYIQRAGFIRGESYFKEMDISDIQGKWNIDLSAVSNQGKAEKRFDFVIKTDHMVYGIETNFYGSSGSKLNETARSYKTLSMEADTVDGFTFVWFTDGKGWNRAKNNLEETFDVMEHIYSIDDMEKGIMTTLFQ